MWSADSRDFHSNGHGVSATPENQYGTKSVAASMTVSLTPVLSKWVRVIGSALRATFIVSAHGPGACRESVARLGYNPKIGVSARLAPACSAPGPDNSTSHSERFAR